MIAPLMEPMIRAAKLGLLVIAGLALSSAASAQRGFGRVSLSAQSARLASARPTLAHSVGGHPIVIHLPVSPISSHIVSIRGASATTTQTMQSNSLFNSTNSDEFAGSQVTLSQLLNPVPGLGFDFSNLAATNRDLAIRALIDPITQQELALSERLLQETPAAPISSAFFGSELQPIVMLEQQPPQVIFVQPPQPQVQEATTETSSSAESSSAAVEQPPLPDVGEFVLVLHDGTQIHAVAFTRQNGRIVYITPDGLRHSFAVDAFDAAATRRLNDERGTPLQIPL